MSPYNRVPVKEGDRIRAGLAMQLVAVPTGIAPEAMVAGVRPGPRQVQARRLAMYLAHVGLGWTVERVGHAFGFNRATVSAGCRWVEDARDDPAVDGLMERLELAVRQVCETPHLEMTRLDAVAVAR